MDSRLVIVLPGGEYGPVGPALRFPILAIAQLGPCETVVVDYPTIASGAADGAAEFIEAVGRQVLAALDAHPGLDVTFVAKSLGTRALAGVCPLLPRDRTMSALWLTPLFGFPETRDPAAGSGLRSLLVAGSADPHHDPAGFEMVASALDAPTLVIPNADHWLEVPGDVHASVGAMGSLAQAVLDFLGS